jgi:hypothetical protein
MVTREVLQVRGDRNPERGLQVGLGIGLAGGGRAGEKRLSTNVLGGAMVTREVLQVRGWVGRVGSGWCVWQGQHPGIGPGMVDTKHLLYCIMYCRALPPPLPTHLTTATSPPSTSLS